MHRAGHACCTSGAWGPQLTLCCGPLLVLTSPPPPPPFKLCRPKYADNFDITSTFCTPLSANPPAPPAPSMAELASRKKALK